MAGEREQLRKRAEAERDAEPFRSDAERKLDQLAEEQANGKRKTKAEAYDDVLRTQEGRGLYAKHRGKHRSAA